MCDQCLTDPLEFGEPMPGWYLMRARRGCDSWKQGDWGLVQCNDPTFTWSLTPTPDPLWGMTDEQEDQWFETADETSADYYRTLKLISTPEFYEYRNQFRCSPGTGYELVTAMQQVGYDPFKDGRAADWLFGYLGKWLTTAPMTEGGDPFPSLEKTNPSDKTIGRDPLPHEPHAKKS